MGKNYKRSPTAEANPALSSLKRQPRWHLPALAAPGSWGLCIIAQDQTVEEPAFPS